jgi:hypothetical protein
MTRILFQVGKTRPESSLELFEDLSSAAKKPLQADIYSGVNFEVGDEKLREQLTATIKAESDLVAGPPLEGEDEPMDEPEEGQALPDIVGEADMLAWAGVNIGKNEAFKLACSIERLVKDRAMAEIPELLTDVRFFGKIFGLQADYYIVEAKFAEPPEPEEGDMKMEQPGVGVNEYVYFATNSVTQPWTKLPWCTPNMILTSKNMRRFFTGDLKAEVLGFPRFPWGEAAYLRAQIARIVSACCICPKDFFEAGEDDESHILTPTEGFVDPTLEERALYENWVHYRGYLFNTEGRITPFVADDVDDVDMESDLKSLKPLEEKELAIPLLRPIDEDSSNHGIKVWSVRAAPSLSSSHAVISMHNFHWPGAVAAWKGSTWTNVYVGFGHKYLPHNYSPPPPPPIAEEFDVMAVREGKQVPQEQIDPVYVPPPEKDPDADSETRDSEEGEDDD